uniref:Lin-54 DREAM MuvB core complex component n=1 Tax=Salmo trutta TaxID=8032 RepID=A0A673Y7Z7_SALTR
MDVVSPELNILLPDEIMDTEAIVMDDDPPAESPTASGQSQPSDDAPIPMETDVLAVPEIVSLCSDATPTQRTQALTTSITTDSTLCSTTSATQLLLTPSIASSSPLTLRPATASTLTSTSPGVVSLTSGGLQKLSANHQIILNKVASSPGADTTRSPGTTTITPGGQKFMVTAIGKSGQSIVLQLPHTGSKPGSGQGEAKAHPQHFKVLTIGGRTDLKPVMVGQAVSSASQVSTLQAQQLKTVQIAKKTQVSSAGPIKFIITKAVNNKGLTAQTSVSNVITGNHHHVFVSCVIIERTARPMKPVQTVTVGGPQFKTIFPLSTSSNVQQIQVPGSRFHYVRLVTATTGSTFTIVCFHMTSLPSTAKPMVVNTAQVRMSVPIIPAQTMKQVVPKPLTSSGQLLTTQTQQRLIMPATPLPQIQPNLTNLPPGTVLAPGSGNMGYAVLPAHYVTQLQQSAYVTLASSSGFPNPTGIQTQARLPLNGLSTSDAASRPRKPCNCNKSQCLKLYCDCFANGEFCQNCNCTNCFNNLEHETERAKAIKACLDRNPEAFKPKIGKGKEGESDRRHSKGCNCKRSGCLKNYCECYEAKIMCSSTCKCVGCKNFEESPERKTLMHLADAAEVRVQQQTAAKTKLSSQISDLFTRTTPSITSGGGRMPFTFVTKEVAEATCECLLEQAEQAELIQQPQATAERMILEEFGRCLMRIISSAGKTDCPSINC